MKDKADRSIAEIPLQEALTEWLKVFKYPTIQRSTYDGYEANARNYIFPHMGKIRVKDITPIIIKRLFNTMMERGLTYSTTQKTRLILNEFFRYLEKSNRIEHNPMKPVPPIKRSAYESAQGKEYKAQTDRITVFTAEEIALMRNAYYEHKGNNSRVFGQSAVYFLILNTGLRRGEACGILNRDIDIKNRILHVKRSVKYFRKRKDGEIVSGMELTAGIPKTKSSIRDVPLNYVALEMIKELRNERYFGVNSPLLCKSDGSFTNPNELGRRFKEFQIACGINEPKTLHALRHTFATNLINGVEQQDGHIERLTVKQVADILGHTTTEITERYYVKRDNSRLKGLTNQFEL